jgi:hypothetical protein
MTKVRLFIISIFLNIFYYIPAMKQTDYLKYKSQKNILGIRTAGLPSAKFDVQMTTLPRAGISPDTENLGDQTSVQALISPSIFTKYGLTHIDFFKVDLFV